ncbi:MAG: magnesium transporter [Balneolaceae bacterium]
MLQLLKPEIEELIDSRDWVALKESLNDVPAVDIAELLEEIKPEVSAVLFRLLKKQKAAEVFSHLSNSKEVEMLDLLTKRQLEEVMSNLEPDDRVAIVEELPGHLTQRVMNLLNAEEQQEIKQMLGYPSETVGRLMTSRYVKIRSDWTVEQAMRHIREYGYSAETVNVIYVVDESEKLIDDLRLTQLILADPHDRIGDITDDSFVALNAFEDQEHAVEMLSKYDRVAMPVVDSGGILIGIVTVDDIIDIAREEATEDFHKGAAVAPLKATYRETPIRTLFGKRIAWLIILVVVNLLSSGVIEYYEDVLASAIALAFFIPLLIDSGGNTGAQSATIMVRAIAVGDVKLSHWVRVAGKEVFVGLGLGLAMGLASSMLGLFRGGWEIGLIVGLSMVAIVLVANIIGTVLPFLLTRFNIDPAVASSPLITTIVDVTGLLIYFSIAAMVLQNLV